MCASLQTRPQRERWEEAHLAPYAWPSGLSRGRAYPEAQHPYRTEFQRDRDRIVHSRAFRRLEYKTQVFVNGTADHYRTRLTHTIEVAAVSRTLARALRAQEDLAEAIALAHDIGHSPFGHSGERALDELMREEGGFDHNTQSVRAVEILEDAYPGFPGLNLTWEVRAGLRKHLARQRDAMLEGYPLGRQPLLEAQIADVADDITYHAHDVDDGLEAGLITQEDLLDLELWRMAHERALRQNAGASDPALARAAVRCLLDMQVEDVLRESEDRLARFRPSTPEDVMNCPERIVSLSAAMRKRLEPFRSFLLERLYGHPEIVRANREAIALMRALFFYYLEHPEALGRKARARVAAHGLRRTVCDYIAGMTDRYALEEYIKYGLDRKAPPPAADGGGATAHERHGGRP